MGGICGSHQPHRRSGAVDPAASPPGRILQRLEIPVKQERETETEREGEREEVRKREAQREKTRTHIERNTERQGERKHK